MNATFGVTKKRMNSTSSTMTDTTTLDVKLKEPCSMHSPVFIVQGLNKTRYYNYVSWNGKYFYINDQIYKTNDIQEVHCSLDPLSTYKSAIMDTYAFVNYGDSAHRTAYIDDIRFGPDHKNIDSVDRQGVVNIGLDNAHWTIIMSVNACTSLAYNGVLTYAMTPSTFTTVLNAFSNTVITDAQSWTVGDFFEMIQNIFIKIALGGGQAVENIRSIIAVPFQYSSYANNEVKLETNEVGMGPYRVQLNNSTVKILEPVFARTGQSTIYLKRPLTSLGNPWLNSPKYCSVQIGHPCGFTEINDVALIEQNMCYIYWSVCPITGDYSIKITTGNKEDETLSEISGNVSIDLAFLTNGNKTMGEAIIGTEAKILGAALGMGSVTPKTKAVTTTQTGAYDTTSYSTDGGSATERTKHSTGDTKTKVEYDTTDSGIGGSFRVGSFNPSAASGSLGHGAASAFLATSGKAIYYNVEYYLPSIFDAKDSVEYDAYCDEYGYPVGRYMRVGDNSGYVECVGASVGTGSTGIPNATLAEISTINNYLNSGIIIE